MINNELTNVNLFGLSLTLLMVILLILFPRKYAAIPILVTTCFITLGQRIVFLTLDFTMIRILIFFGALRLVIKREIFIEKFNAIDKLVIWWVIASVLIQNVLWQTSGAFINSMGFAYNAIGCYFLFRYLMSDFNDMVRIIRCLAFIIIPLAVAALYENMTGRNIFSIFGGVPEFTPIREGRVRCTISFGDAILAGTFGATVMPLFVAGLIGGQIDKKLGFIAVSASTIITILSHSSGPLAAYVVGIIGFLIWPFRRNLREIRWGLVIGLVSLHMIMKAPVWHLIGRLSNLIGGKGYYRVELINAFIDHFGEWWLIGTKYTAHWGLVVLAINPNSSDITNQFISEGINGGLLRVFLFIAIIVLSFRSIGRSIKTASKYYATPTQLFLWSMGVALTSHIVSFMSVTYFSQIEVLWYMQLAMISSSKMIFDGNKDKSGKTNNL